MLIGTAAVSAAPFDWKRAGNYLEERNQYWRREPVLDGGRAWI